MAFDRNSSAQGMQRPLRVALFSGNYNYTVDGANKSLNRLVDHLERRSGAVVRVYSPTGETAAFPPAGELISVPSVAIPTRPDYRLALGLTPGVRRDLATFSPDLIHLSAPDLLGTAALRMARRLNVPAVASLHTRFDTYLDYYRLGWLKPAIQQRLHKFYSTCDYVLAPSSAIAEELRAEDPAARVRIWARGVDPDMFQPQRRSQAWRQSHGFDATGAVIVFLGRIVLEKGLAVFVETVRRLEAAHGPMQVLVIGDGPAAPWLREQLPDAVFTGFLAGEALATAVASGDVFLNPSTTETFGNVTLEAMASGLAPVCADVASSHALIQHGRSGLLCAASDPAAYCEAVGQLIADPAKRAEVACEAHRQSIAYRWSDILDGVVDVYGEALARRRQRREPANDAHQLVAPQHVA